jgi:hypothetical protein
MRHIGMFVTVLLGVGAMAGCSVGGAGYPARGYDDYYPTDAYIATTEPVYFEGRPAYWYGGRWYYQNGRRWNHYEREPPALYQRRIRAPLMRRTYEPPAGRSGLPGEGPVLHDTPLVLGTRNAARDGF